MTDITAAIHANVGFRSNSVAAIRDFFVTFCGAIREGREIETRYRALSRMTPSKLAALGLTRSDIARAALTAPEARFLLCFDS